MTSSNITLDSFMEIDLKTKILEPAKKEHPSNVQRRILEEARQKRLTEALRQNLRKRKEQVRGRKTD
jgi:hypothetical protein